MTNSPTPKAAQEHRCVEIGYAGGMPVFKCACGQTFREVDDEVATVNAFTEHVLAASRGEAPASGKLFNWDTKTKLDPEVLEDNIPRMLPEGEAPAFSEAQRERAALALHRFDCHPNCNAIDESHRKLVDAILAALKETP